MSFFKSTKNGVSGYVTQKNKRIFVFVHDIVALLAAMQLSMWFVLKDDLQLLSRGFTIKQSLVFALISSGFFLWLQTYKGVWRYVSWRQSVLIIGILALASLIYYPILIKAHMQPIDIPGSIVLVNWAVAGSLLVGSRFFFRVFYERWLINDESSLTDTPVSRIILVGSGERTEQFLKDLKKKKETLYEVVGIVDSDPEIGSLIQGTEVLGYLSDLPDLIENLNVEGMHPHHIVLMHENYLGKRARELLSNMSSFKVDFMKVGKKGCDLHSLSIEDIFYQHAGKIAIDGFLTKNVLIYGASCPIGHHLADFFNNSSCPHIILWDQNAHDLAFIKESIQSNKITLFSKNSYEDEQLLSYFKKEKIDIFINLKAFSAIEVESLDPSLSYEVYIEENERLSNIAQKAGVKNYYFITQQAPHCELATKLAQVTGHLLRKRSENSKLTYAMVNLPYILHNEDQFFKGEKQISITQESVPVVSPTYGAHMLGRIIDAIITKVKWNAKKEFQMETIPYFDLSNHFSQLNHNAPAPTYTMDTDPVNKLMWNNAVFQNLQAALKRMDYNNSYKYLNSMFSTPKVK